MDERQGGCRAQRETVMLDLMTRRARQRQHPAFHRHGYLLKTATLNAVQGSIADWVELGKSGMSFSGLSRAGKTYALMHIARELQALFPTAAFVYLTAEIQSKADHLNHMYCDFLGQLHKQALMRPQASNLLAYQLLSMCRDRGGTECVILLDEAQKLSMRHWQALGIVWNRMDLEGVRTMIFPVGNEELHRLATMSTESGYDGVVGRFFVQRMDFDGVCSKEQLAVIMSQYDSLFYPAPDTPFSRYFACEAYDVMNWRMVQEVDSFWAALTTHSGVADSELKHGYSMQWVTDPVHYMFKEMLNRDDCRPGEKSGLPWLKAIERTCPAKIC